MSSNIRLFLVVLAMSFTSSFAVANDVQNESPEELVEEMGLEEPASSVLSDMMFNDVQPRLHIKVDKSLQGTSPTAQTMEIYLDGNLIHTLLVSTGRQQQELAKSGRTYFSSTPTGTFKIYRRSRNHFSQTWQAPMPFAQFFNGGIAIHATTKDHYEELGSRASGGCVRVTYENAEMIWNLVEEIGVAQTRITVIDNGL